MGRIILSPAILGNNFGEVVLRHVNNYIIINGLNKSEVVKDLNSGAKGDEYVRLFNKHFKDDLIIRMT